MNTSEFLLNSPINGFSFTHPTTAFLNSTNFIPETSMSTFATCWSFERKEARRNETDAWQWWNLRISHMHNNSSLYRQDRGPLAQGRTANERPLPLWLQVQTPSKPLLVYTECPCSSQWHLALTTNMSRKVKYLFSDTTMSLTDLRPSEAYSGESTELGTAHMHSGLHFFPNHI